MAGGEHAPEGKPALSIYLVYRVNAMVKMLLA
jgi:hypothetical protein